MTTPTPSSYDFDDNLQGLITFMRSQPEFSDFNFDGSGLRALMRLLAYDAQQSAFRNQFTYNELSLGTAQLRENIVGLAADTGYFSRGRASATAVSTVVVTPKDSPTATLTMTKETRFFANRDGVILYFVPDQNYVAPLVDGVYTFTDIKLIQGVWTYASFASQSDNAVEQFVIADEGVDTDTLTVQVRNNDTSLGYEVYTKFQTAYDLGPSSRVYFLKENRDGLFEMEFGDGKVAKQLSYGNIILVEYLSTDGATGNGVNKLTPATGIGGYFDIKVTVKDQAFGGAEKEDVASIRKNAPLSFAEQGSAVAPGDYVSITKKVFPEADSVIAWGGENNNPIQIGYVFLAVSLGNGQPLTSIQKETIKNLVEQFNVGSIDVIVVDPEYVFLIVDTTVSYNPRKTVLNEQSFVGKIEDYIRKFSSEKLEEFGVYFNKSKLVEYINKIDTAVSGNDTVVKYQKRFWPALNFSGTYSFDFARTILPGSVIVENFIVSDTDSAGFTYFIKDNGLGALELAKRAAETGNVVTLRTIGQVDYSTGKIDLVAFRPIAILNGFVSLIVKPVGDESLQGFGKDILRIDSINVTPKEKVSNA